MHKVEKISKYPLVTLRDISDYEKYIDILEIQPIQKWAYEFPGVQGIAMKVNISHKDVVEFGAEKAIFKFLNKKDERIIFPNKKTNNWILIPNEEIAKSLEKEELVNTPEEKFLRWINGSRSYKVNGNPSDDEDYPICTG